MQSNVEYHGIIQRRRCLGKHLAFADILMEQGEEDDKHHRVVKVAFHRELIQSPPSDDFPVKKSSLPYNAKIRFTCDEPIENEKMVELCKILTWKLLSDPREEAVKNSTVIDQNGISCTSLLRARRNAFDSVNQRQHTTDKIKRAKESSLPQLSSGEDNPHGSNQTKGRRAQVFARFIREHLLENDGSDHVLDIAGGKGFLSLELARQAGISATVVDPLIRKPLKNYSRVTNPPQFVHAYFDPKKSKDLIAEHSCLVGLHPDECTEAILDAALQARKSVAIVPCCVFPSLFPMRHLTNGKVVRTYEDFIDFLVQKDDSLQKVTLPFDGKNICIYRKSL